MMKPLLNNLITQTILPFNDITMNINEGDILGISFDNELLIDYSLLITNVSITSLKRISNKDISKNGFLYRPAFLDFMKNFRNVNSEDSVVKLDFELVENEV